MGGGSVLDGLHSKCKGHRAGLTGSKLAKDLSETEEAWLKRQNWSREGVP